MSVLSLPFLLLLLITLLLYYLTPRRCQWLVLLLASTAFYLAAGLRSFFYLLVTSVSTYAASRLMHRVSVAQKAFLKANKLSRNEKAAFRRRNGRKRRALLIGALAVNLGLLCVFKYAHFALAQFNALAGLFGFAGLRGSLRLLAPLGISFYTFQSVGYLVDVYSGAVEPERNYFRLLLFISFFPQLTQGPISAFEDLGAELAREHEPEEKNLFWGFQRLLWGFMKKMVIANALAPCTATVFTYYPHYTGVTTLLGAFLYLVQLYADFSGYMDIMCGYCEMLGIRLTENFNRPFCARSVAEYWRRWHISLGQWFKKYVYYPIGVSPWSLRLGKRCRERLGEHFAKTLPATIALLATWFATGLWHGASWGYIAWGLLNGLFIILSLWLAPVYARLRAALAIGEENRAFQAFQVARTFTLMALLEVLPEVGTFGDGLRFIGHIFANHRLPASLAELIPFVDPGKGYQFYGFLVALVGVALLLVVSMLTRRRPLRAAFGELPVGVQVVALSALVVLILAFGVPASWGAEGFMYANF